MAAVEHHIPGMDLPQNPPTILSRHKSQTEAVDQDDASKRATASKSEFFRSGHPAKRLTQNRAPKNDSLIAIICQWTVEHQVGLSVNLLLLHALAHMCFPRARQSTRKFYQLSYYNTSTGKYAAGWDDLYMVAYSIIVLTGLRAATLDYVLVPLAQMLGVTKKKDKLRFAEQGWILIYDSVIWSLGMYIMYNHEHWLNLRELWTGWPSRELKGSMKWYYLVQFSFWLQQIVIVNIEERRKDHWQMFTHHVITCILMVSSYVYHQTKVGNLILCLMDIVDVFLAFAKILKYLKFQLACDVAFGVFMLVWFVARHVLYLKTVYSLYSQGPEEMTYGCYSGTAQDLRGPFEIPDPYEHLVDPYRNPVGVVCFNDNINSAFVCTLLALQVILLLWFGMIIRVAMKVLRGGEAEDSRSDDEGEIGGDYEPNLEQQSPPSYKDPIELRPLEEVVGVEGINFGSQKSSPSRRFRKGGGVASGVTLHSDRKELLGRIGCDGGHDV